MFDFRENSIAVNIPFHWMNHLGDEVGNKAGDKAGDKKPLNARRKKILKEMRNNPNITQAELVPLIGVKLTAIENNIRFLKENGYIERKGSKKTGYWEVK